MDQDMNNMELRTAASLVQNKFNALNVDLGITFEAYSIIMPIEVNPYLLRWVISEPDTVFALLGP